MKTKFSKNRLSNNVFVLNKINFRYKEINREICANLDLTATNNEYFMGSVIFLARDDQFCKFFEIDLDDYRKKLNSIGETVLHNETTYFKTEEDIEEAKEYIESLLILNKLCE